MQNWNAWGKAWGKAWGLAWGGADEEPEGGGSASFVFPTYKAKKIEQPKEPDPIDDMVLAFFMVAK